MFIFLSLAILVASFCIIATLTMLVAARDAGVRRFIYAGSSSVYGDTPRMPKREDMPAKPLSPYAVTKYVDELYGKVFTDIYELPTVGLRLRPRRWLSSLIALLVLVLGPLLTVAVGGVNLGADWRTADRSSTGIAPDAASTPEAIVQIYAARAFNWRGAFGVHTWIATKERDAGGYLVHQVLVVFPGEGGFRYGDLPCFTVTRLQYT